MYKILVVEDEESIAKMIEVTLSMGDYQCSICNNGIDAKDKIDKERFDLILLDVMLPGMDGFTLMEYIRPLKTPVIFITAKQEVTDRVKGLKLGAEDYILKPFDSMELLARMEVVLRRYHSEEDNIVFNNIEIDVSRHMVLLEGENVSLTPKEFEVLLFFIKHKDIVVRKERLMAEVWGYDFSGETRTVETHVQQLRRKLKLQQELITIPKVGFCLKGQV